LEFKTTTRHITLPKEKNFTSEAQITNIERPLTIQMNIRTFVKKNELTDDYTERQITKFSSTMKKNINKKILETIDTNYYHTHICLVDFDFTPNTNFFERERPSIINIDVTVYCKKTFKPLVEDRNYELIKKEFVKIQNIITEEIKKQKHFTITPSTKSKNYLKKNLDNV
jgi:hypothetical protein